MLTGLWVACRIWVGLKDGANTSKMKIGIFISGITSLRAEHNSRLATYYWISDVMHDVMHDVMYVLKMIRLSSCFNFLF